MAQQPPGGPQPPHYRSFTITDTPHLVWLLYTSDQPEAETSTWQHTITLTPAGFERAIPTSERSQTHALDRAVTGTGGLRPTLAQNNDNNYTRTRALTHTHFHYPSCKQYSIIHLANCRQFTNNFNQQYGSRRYPPYTSLQRVEKYSMNKQT